jgi:hypothetical protein
MDPMLCHRPGLAEDGYMMGDDSERPPVPPRGMSGGGDMIDMDDNDLDVAASMMAGLSLGGVKTGVTAVDDGDDEDDNSSGGNSGNSGNSDRSYNSGETASDRTGYAFDDPLGKAGGLGIELGKLTKYRPSETRRINASPRKQEQEDDNGSHSSSDEEPETQQDSDNDVPVMDLFAGNFNNNDETTSMETPVVEEFANFADFEKGEDAFGDFESAGPLPPSDTPTALHQSSSIESKKTDIDDLFGSGDHANLLEQDEDELATHPGNLTEVQKENESIIQTIAHPDAASENQSPSSQAVAEAETEMHVSSPDDKEPSDNR